MPDLPAPTVEEHAWPEVLGALVLRRDLTQAQAGWAMEQVLAGEATAAQIAGFVVGLRAKGESPGEVAALVDTMLRHATLADVPGPVVDTCGTGGDRAHTVNISTMAAVVVAASGARVVKHGNRAASSASGSADVLEALGVVVDLPAARIASCVDQAGIAFCFAPLFHPALRHAASVRRELGVATVFNFLGPLANPARPRHQAMGVSDARMAEVAAHVLAGRGSSALVFRGEDGLDELSIAGPSRVWVVHDGTVAETVLDPRDVGLSLAPTAALRGGDAAQNAAVMHRVLDGQPGPVRDAVLLNAAAGLVAMDLPTDGLDHGFRDALVRVAEAVDSGAARATLASWVRVSTELSRP